MANMALSEIYLNLTLDQIIKNYSPEEIKEFTKTKIDKLTIFNDIINITSKNSIKDKSLYDACFKGDEILALKIIENNSSSIDFVDEYGTTALIYACQNKMNIIAYNLVKSGKSIPEQINSLGKTALICACDNKMDTVLSAIIKTGKSNIKHINELKSDLTCKSKKILNKIIIGIINSDDYELNNEYNELIKYIFKNKLQKKINKKKLLNYKKKL